MMKIHLSAFIITLSCSFSVLAQDFRSGYVITNSGDSISGYVQYRSKKSSSRICFFKKEKKSHVKKYTPDEIVVYAMFGDRRFAVKEINTGRGRSEKVFVESLVLGKMSLYRYQEVFYIAIGNEFILLPKNEKKIIDTSDGKKMYSNNEYVSILDRYLADCSLTAKTSSYGELPLTNLVQNYNRCKGGAGLNFKENKPSTKGSIHVFAGIDNSTLNIEGVEGAFKTDRSAMLGLGFELSVPRITDKVSFSLELISSKKNYLGYYERSSGQTISREDYNIQVSFVKIPLGFRYNFLEPPNTPYVKGGIVFFFPGKSSLELLAEEEKNGTISTSYSNYDFKAKRSTGYWLGVGYSHAIIPKASGFIELRIERTNGFVGEDFVDSISTTTNLNFIIGVRF